MPKVYPIYDFSPTMSPQGACVPVLLVVTKQWEEELEVEAQEYAKKKGCPSTNWSIQLTTRLDKLSRAISNKDDACQATLSFLAFDIPYTMPMAHITAVSL